MIAEMIVAAYVVESSRALYRLMKEHRRKTEIRRLFLESLNRAATWGDLLQSMERNKAEHPDLYVPVPQTWLGKMLNKDD
jgi:hypothetical protein